MLIAPWLLSKTGDPKGAVPWNPGPRLKSVGQDSLAVLHELAKADALPVGPRTTGYKLRMRKNASGLVYVKAHYDANGKVSEKVIDGYATFKDVEDAIKRLRQAGDLDWSWISDGSAVDHPVGGYASLEEWLAKRLDPERFFRDLRFGQRLVPEIYSESAELTPLIHRVAVGYGVRTYSGRGSGGPALAREVAVRAWNRFTADDGNGGIARTKTLILGIGDLDHAGVQNVMRPHVEHVAAFLRGFAAEAVEDDKEGERFADHILKFRRIAITPEQAVEINAALGNDTAALEAYRDSGSDDWSRDLRFLKQSPKTEVEALDPATLRGVIREALYVSLNIRQLEAVKAEEEQGREQIPALVEKLNGGPS